MTVPPAPERDLARLLADLDARRRPGEYVLVAAPAGGAPSGLAVEALVREDEGTTLVVERAAADGHGLTYDFVAAWLTLTVHSALDAVGLTAAVAARLTEAGIGCNVLAGLHHDHLLVPADRAADALAALRRA